MSVSAAPAPPLARRRRLNLPRAALRVELAKLTEQLTVRLVIAVCLLAPLGFAVIMTIQSAVPADTLFGRWAKASGFAASLTVLGFACSFGLPFLAGVLAGDIFSSEDRHGTWKTVLTRSCTRADLFVGKTVAAAAATLAALAALALSSLLGGLALLGSDPLVGLSGQLVPAGRTVELVLASWAFTLLPTLAFVALALLLSVATRSLVVGVLGPGVVGLVVQLLSLVGPGEIVRAVLPATPFDAWHGLFTSPAHYGPLIQGAVTSTVYIVVFLALAWRVLGRRAFAAADDGSKGPRRIPLRPAIAAAAVFAFLVVASGWGPTNVTAGRLEAAIGPTFENLVLLQTRWRTNTDSISGEVHVRTACKRASGKLEGPGDDWGCIVRAVIPQVQSPSLTLEVTLRANGCFTAEAPPAIVGPELIRDTRGRSFINPLTTFDGCFGTA